MSFFTFQNTTRIGNDFEDNSQRNLDNAKYGNYVLENFFNTNVSNSHIDFATNQPSMNFRGNGGGSGIPGNAIDSDSQLILKTEQERALDKLQLNQRLFITIPYLGRGSCNPVLESQLQQGANITDKKSVTTIMDKPYIDYLNYPLLEEKKQQMNNPSFTIEDSAYNGWVRGGIPSRKTANEDGGKYTFAS